MTTEWSTHPSHAGWAGGGGGALGGHSWWWWWWWWWCVCGGMRVGANSLVLGMAVTPSPWCWGGGAKEGDRGRCGHLESLVLVVGGAGMRVGGGGMKSGDGSRGRCSHLSSLVLSMVESRAVDPAKISAQRQRFDWRWSKRSWGITGSRSRRSFRAGRTMPSRTGKALHPKPYTLNPKP